MKKGWPKGAVLVALLASGLLAGTLSGDLIWQAAKARADRLNLAASNLQEAVRGAGNEISKSIELTDMVMVAGANSLVTPEGSGDRHALLRRLSVFTPQAELFELFDASGRLVASSRSPDPPVSSAADQDFFTLHRDGGLQFYIGPPLARDGGRPWLIPVSRRLDAGNGTFAGVIRALLSADQMGDGFRIDDITDADRILLIGGDGIIAADSAPRGRRLVGRRLAEALPGVAAAVDTGAGLADGQMVASYRLADFPYRAVALRSEREVVAPWLPFAGAMVAAAALVVLGTLLAAFVILRQERMRAAIYDSLRRRERAIEAVGSGVIITDARRGSDPIVYANPAFERLTGYTSSEVLGRNPRFLYGDEGAQQGLAEVRASLAEAREALVVLRNRRKDGTRFWCELLVTPVRDDTGAITHHLGVQRDITERMESEAQLRQTNAELEASNAELERFAYVASHDLQEPLRTVASYVQLLERRYSDRLDPDAHDFIAFAVAGVKRMQEQIIDLLEYSRLMRASECEEPVDLGQCMTSVVADLRRAIDDAGADIEVCDLPTVSGDRRQLTSLLENLVGNAVKYRSPDRKPVIRVGCRLDGEHWQFSVADNGIGIAPEYHDKVFGLFQRLHPRERYPGTGIGLAVCKRIVERHKGRIWIESAEGQGSDIRFTLPRQGV